MLFNLPDWLDPLDEQVDRGTIRHGVGSLHVLVHSPELVDGAEVRHRLDVCSVPTSRIVHREQGVRVLQSTIDNQC